MKLALDTNTYRAFMRGAPDTVQLVRGADEVLRGVPRQPLLGMSGMAKT